MSDIPLSRPLGLAVCPRCAADLSSIDGTCSNRNCSWPNPEPGTITAIRVRLKAGANAYLQSLRERGLWPPIP